MNHWLLGAMVACGPPKLGAPVRGCGFESRGGRFLLLFCILGSYESLFERDLLA